MFIDICRSTFAVDGVNCKVNGDVERVLKDFHAAKKPIGSVIMQFMYSKI